MPALIQAAGVWYFVALGAVFLAAAAKHAGAARSPEEDHQRGVLDRVHWLISLLGWGLLVLHGVISAASQAAPPWLLVGLPVAAMLSGAILGGVVGADARALAPTMRTSARWLGLTALALSLWAAWPSLAVLFGVAHA